MIRKWLFGVIPVGLALGYVAVETLAPAPRAERALEMFVDYCLPFQRGDVLAPDRFDHMEGAREGGLWVDPVANLGLSWTEKSCLVDDPFHMLSGRDLRILRRKLPGVVAAHLPDLADKFANDHGTLMWMEGPTGKPDRWGVGLVSTWVEDGGAAVMMLSFTPPIAK